MDIEGVEMHLAKIAEALVVIAKHLEPDWEPKRPTIVPTITESRTATWDDEEEDEVDSDDDDLFGDQT